MVFCYKIITESPRRSASHSPRKVSPTVNRISNKPSTMSHMYNPDDAMDMLGAVPEHDWRLLAALARKRDDDDEREKLADQFKKMWQREKEERDMIATEISGEYNKYLHKKREEERTWLDFKRMQKTAQRQLEKEHLMNCIRHKERRSADFLAWQDDKKISDLVDRALEKRARIHLAADRRLRLNDAEESRRRFELSDAQKREDEAKRRRSALIRDNTQRIAIYNTLSTWEASLLRQEVEAADAARRAHHAAHAAMTDACSINLAKAKATRHRKSRQLAAFTAQLRDLVRGARS